MGRDRYNKNQTGKRPEGQRPEGRPQGKRPAAKQFDAKRQDQTKKPGPGHDQKRERPSRQETSRPTALRHSPRSLPHAEGGQLWLFGFHAVNAALRNPRRRALRLLSVGPLGPDLQEALKGRKLTLGVEVVPRIELDRLLPPNVVHQGIALLATPLQPPSLEDFISQLGPKPAVVVALDHVTDPHNVGAILRSASAFGAAALLVTDDHAPPESGTLAKAASGALEHLTLLREVNLVRALERLKHAGFWITGLDESGERTLPEMEPGARSVIVLGAEGEGLRRLTRDRCDLLACLPTQGPIGALNVSNAAAIALYELLGRPAALRGSGIP